MIRAVHVVIPARNEERRLPRCLDSVEVARVALRQARPDLVVEVTVVLDRCLDRSAEVARRALVHRLTVEHGNVGAARHAGVRAALAVSGGRGVDPEDLWVACTDADTVVPPHWLTGHLALSDTHDAVVGTVEPLGLTDASVLSEWRARHRLGEGHPHVHGANLGLRGSAYLEVGGFRAMATDEDVDLIRRIRAHTGRWVATDTVRVASSARRTPRARGGFSDYLTSLEAEVRTGEAADGHPRQEVG
ncbi:glycosyltransferase [Knoellia aerolata]|uniref:4,4'-diaponeurosporenoate glycosyltransferase n=1 Tax=Knoellia aerolata DSM 18566 TaxID=1385519 RepID=A0A0A0K1P4_9MICO|nr:glycosyltransferase [Knoellia aerolata]KGN42252.1 glycosyl transferase family 2 [Knoellia aerolata DSM 18566]